MKYYDKIFFVIAVIVAGLSCGYYFMNEPKGELLEARVQTLEKKLPAGIPWKKIIVPELKVTSIEWPEVRAQDEAGKWFFQVCTPPQIWVDKKGNFMTESPYYKEVARQSFALKYVGVSNEPYPIKYLGYFGTKAEPIIQFENTSTNLSFIGKLNEEIVASAPSTGKKINLGLTPKKFEIKRVKNDKNNTISDIVTVVLYDKSLGKDVTIYSNKETVIDDRRRISFSAPDGSIWHVKAPGESRKVGTATYKVKSIDFDKGNAVIEMIPDNTDIEPQTMNLSAAGVVPVK